MKKYIAYTTLWSEGVVVVREDDRRFPIGTDQISGNTVYSEHFPEDAQIIAIEVSIEEAVKLDTAFYHRKGKERIEMEEYKTLLEEYSVNPLEFNDYE